MTAWDTIPLLISVRSPLMILPMTNLTCPFIWRTSIPFNAVSPRVPIKIHQHFGMATTAGQQSIERQNHGKYIGLSLFFTPLTGPGIFTTSHPSPPAPRSRADLLVQYAR